VESFVVRHGFQDAPEHPCARVRTGPESVEDEGADGGVAHDAGAPEDPEVTGNRGLRQAENGLEIRDEERSGHQAIENAESGRLGDGPQQGRGRGEAGHMRPNEYRTLATDASAAGNWIALMPTDEGYCSMFASLMLATALAAQTPDSVHLVIVATSDLHGHATDWDYVASAGAPGGLIRAATVVDSLRTRYPDQVVLVDAGDLIEGDLFGTYFARIAPRDPHPIIDVMNAMGYDAATPGEHEFDFGVSAMTRMLAGANFPYVSGNLRVPGRDTLAYAAYRVVRRQGLRIGISGFTTPGVMVWSRKQIEGRLRVARIEASADRVLSELRKDADLAIVLVHSGLDGPSTYDTTGVGRENAAAALSQGEIRPDLVVLGHSHRELADSVLNGVHFVQPGPFAQSTVVVHVDLRRQSGGWRVVRMRGQLVPLKTVAASPRVRRRLGEADNSLRIWASQVVASSSGRMRTASARAEDTPIVRYINEVQRKRAGADLAATPVFDVKAGFDLGEITNAQVYALYPTEYTLRAIRISGAQLAAYLEQSARYFYSDSTGRVAVNALVPAQNYDIVGGAQYAIDLSRRPGERIRDLSVNGRPIQPGDSFTIALSSYRQDGGGNFSMLANARVLYDRDESIRDLLLSDLKTRRTLRPEEFAGPGWRIVPETAARAARALWVREAAPEAPVAATGVAVPLFGPAGRRDSIEVDRAGQRGDSLAGRPVATIKLPLRRGNPSALGSLVADAYRAAFRADLALVSNEEIRADLAAGPLTASGAAAILEPGHILRKISMTGADLRWVFENLVLGAAPCCHLSGAVVSFASNRKDWERVKDVRQSITGKRLDAKQTYTLVISDYLVTPGGGFPLGSSECSAPFGCARSGLLGHWVVEEGPTSSLDAWIAYLRRLPQPVEGPGDARVVPAK